MSAEALESLFFEVPLIRLYSLILAMILPESGSLGTFRSFANQYHEHDEAATNA